LAQQLRLYFAFDKHRLKIHSRSQQPPRVEKFSTPPFQFYGIKNVRRNRLQLASPAVKESKKVGIGTMSSQFSFNWAATPRPRKVDIFIVNKFLNQGT